MKKLFIAQILVNFLLFTTTISAHAQSDSGLVRQIFTTGFNLKEVIDSSEFDTTFSYKPTGDKIYLLQTTELFIQKSENYQRISYLIFSKKTGLCIAWRNYKEDSEAGLDFASGEVWFGDNLKPGKHFRGEKSFDLRHENGKNLFFDPFPEPLILPELTSKEKGDCQEFQKDLDNFLTGVKVFPEAGLSQFELTTEEKIVWSGRMDSLKLNEIINWGKTLPRVDSTGNDYTGLAKIGGLSPFIEIYYIGSLEGVILWNKPCARNEGEETVYYRRSIDFTTHQNGNLYVLSCSVLKGNGKIVIEGKYWNKELERFQPVLDKEELLYLLEKEYKKLTVTMKN